MRIILGGTIAVLFYICYWFFFIHNKKRNYIETTIFRLKWDYIAGMCGGCLSMIVGG